MLYHNSIFPCPSHDKSSKQFKYCENLKSVDVYVCYTNKVNVCMTNEIYQSPTKCPGKNFICQSDQCMRSLCTKW